MAIWRPRVSGPRRVKCDACGSKRGETCRSITGFYPGRAVSYTHRARMDRWDQLRRRNREFPFERGR